MKKRVLWNRILKRAVLWNWMLIICIAIVLLVIIIYLSFLFVKSNTDKNINSKDYLNIDNMTITEIYKNADSIGIEFCSKIKDISLRENCMIESIYNDANEEGNPDLCDQIKNVNLSYDCKRKVIYAAVGIKYIEESNLTGNINIIPSNINLCEKLNNAKDRDYCKDPKKMVMDIPLWIYKLWGVFCYK